MQKLYQLWYIDLKARRRFQVWTILIAFAYGVFNSIALGRSEKQVTWETLGVICFLTVGLSVFYCLRPATSEVSSPSAQLGEIFRHRRLLEIGLVSIVVLLVLSLAGATPYRWVQAASTDMRLRHALSSPHPFDPNTINQISTAVRRATADQVPINRRLVNVAGQRLLEASRENPHAWPGALAFMSYRSAFNSETPSAVPKTTCFAVSGITGIGPQIAESRIANCVQELDHIAWQNVVFDKVTVIYHGGPTILDHVQFKNCEFILEYTLPSEQLGESLLASDNVTFSHLTP